MAGRALATGAAERAELARDLAAARADSKALWREREKLAAQLAAREVEAARLVREVADQRKAAEQAGRTAEALRGVAKAAEKASAEARERGRQLEAAIGGGSGPARLAERNKALKLRCDDLERTVAEAKADLEARAREIDSCRSEVAVLLRALEVRVADLGLDDGDGGHDQHHQHQHQHQHGGGRDRGAAVRAGLLYELAASERARAALAASAARSAALEKAATTDLAAALGRLESERRGRLAAEERHAAAASTGERSSATCAALEAKGAELEGDKRTMLKALTDLKGSLAKAERDGIEWRRRALASEGALAEEHGARQAEVEGLGKQVKDLTLRASQVNTR
jgi:hypothetical protein